MHPFAQPHQSHQHTQGFEINTYHKRDNKTPPHPWVTTKARFKHDFTDDYYLMTQRMCQLSVQVPSITLIPSIELDRWSVQYEHSISKRVLLAQITLSLTNIV